MFDTISIIGCGLIGSSILRAIKSKNLAKEIKHVRKWSKKFYDTFKELNIQTNKTSVNFLLIKFDRVKKTSQQVFHALAKAGILLRQMNVYSIKNSLRITVGNNKENLKLIIELKKILNV